MVSVQGVIIAIIVIKILQRRDAEWIHTHTHACTFRYYYVVCTSFTHTAVAAEAKAWVPTLCSSGSGGVYKCGPRVRAQIAAATGRKAESRAYTSRHASVSRKRGGDDDDDLASWTSGYVWRHSCASGADHTTFTTTIMTITVSWSCPTWTLALVRTTRRARTVKTR